MNLSPAPSISTVYLSKINPSLGIADIEQYKEDYELLELYNNKCQELSDKSIYFDIPNSGEMRSQITSSHIFRTTQTELLYYTTGFRKNIFNDKFFFRENLSSCLDRCKNVEIIVDDHFDTNITKIVAEKQKKYPNKIKLFKAPVTIKKYLSEILAETMDNEYGGYKDVVKTNFHFSIGDQSKYRLEYDGMDRLAKVNYGDVANAQTLKQVFNLVKTKSTQFIYI